MICASRGVVLYEPGWAWPPHISCPPSIFLKHDATVCIRMLWFVVCLTSDTLNNNLLSKCRAIVAM